MIRLSVGPAFLRARLPKKGKSLFSFLLSALSSLSLSFSRSRSLSCSARVCAAAKRASPAPGGPPIGSTGDSKPRPCGVHQWIGRIRWPLPLATALLLPRCCCLPISPFSLCVGERERLYPASVCVCAGLIIPTLSSVARSSCTYTYTGVAWVVHLPLCVSFPPSYGWMFSASPPPSAI